MCSYLFLHSVIRSQQQLRVINKWYGMLQTVVSKEMIIIYFDSIVNEFSQISNW